MLASAAWCAVVPRTRSTPLPETLIPGQRQARRASGCLCRPVARIGISAPLAPALRSKILCPTASRRASSSRRGVKWERPVHFRQMAHPASLTQDTLRSRRWRLRSMGSRAIRSCTAVQRLEVHRLRRCRGRCGSSDASSKRSGGPVTPRPDAARETSPVMPASPSNEMGSGQGVQGASVRHGECAGSPAYPRWPGPALFTTLGRERLPARIRAVGCAP